MFLVHLPPKTPYLDELRKSQREHLVLGVDVVGRSAQKRRDSVMNGAVATVMAAQQTSRHPVDGDVGGQEEHQLEAEDFAQSRQEAVGAFVQQRELGDHGPGELDGESGERVFEDALWKFKMLLSEDFNVTGILKLSRN